MALPSQEDLVVQQYANLKKNLGTQTRLGKQDLEQRLNRQAAITGTQGGAQMKAKTRQLQEFERAQQGAQFQTGAAEAEALQRIAAQREQQQYGTSERESSQSFQSSERLAGQIFSAAERVATFAFQAAESALGRAFTTSEREAIQAYQRGERIDTQNFTDAQRQAVQAFQSAERQAQQQYGTSEREASQVFQAAEAQLNRRFTTSEREAIQVFQDAQRQAGQQFQTGERLGAEAFARLEAIAGRQFTTAEREAIQAFQTAERMGTQQFAAGQSQAEREFQGYQRNLDRDQASLQFRDSLRFQQESLGQELQFRWQELNENVRTNVFNAYIAMATSGAKPWEMDDRNRVQFLNNLFGSSNTNIPTFGPSGSTIGSPTPNTRGPTGSFTPPSAPQGSTPPTPPPPFNPNQFLSNYQNLFNVGNEDQFFQSQEFPRQRFNSAQESQTFVQNAPFNVSFNSQGVPVRTPQFAERGDVVISSSGDGATFLRYDPETGGPVRYVVTMRPNGTATRQQAPLQSGDTNIFSMAYPPVR